MNFSFTFGDTEVSLDSTPTAEEEIVNFLSPDEELKYLQNKKLQDEIKLRKDYAKTSKRLAWTWAWFSMGMALLQFFKPYGNHLEQMEFIAIVATALATVIALYIQVGKGMFSKIS